MKKNIKSIFLITVLLVLLVGITSVNATDDANNQSVTDTNTIIQEAPTGENTDTVITETKEIKKTTQEKNVKTTTKTVEVNNYDELTTTINNAAQDADNDEYIINLNSGTYQITANTMLNAGTKTPNITINANQQTLSGSTTTLYTRFNNGCNVTINDE